MAKINLSDIEETNEDSAILALYAQIDVFISDITASPTLLDSIPGLGGCFDPKDLVKLLIQIRNDPEIKKALAIITLNNPLRRDRIKDRDKNLPPFIVVRDINGEFIISFLAKDNRADNTKRGSAWDSGAKKVRKIVLESTSRGFEVYVELIVKPKDQAEMTEAIREFSEQQYFEHTKGIAKIRFGGFQQPKLIKGTSQIRGGQLVFLAPYKHNLFELLQSEWRPVWMQNMSNHDLRQYCINLFEQLISAVQEMHKAGKEHKDLKPENLLIDVDNVAQTLELSITDFGDVKDFGKPETLAGTTDFMPPWQLQKILGGNTIDQIEILASQHPNLARLLDSYAWRMLKTIALDNNRIVPRLKNEVIIRGKQDVWALGILYIQIMYGNLSFEQIDLLVERDAFLRRIFKLDPEEIPIIQKIDYLFKRTDLYKQYHRDFTMRPTAESNTSIISNTLSTLTTNISGNSGHTVALNTLWFTEPVTAMNEFVFGRKNKRNELINSLKSICPNPDSITSLKLLQVPDDYALIMQELKYIQNRKLNPRQLKEFAEFVINLRDVLIENFEGRKLKDEEWIQYAKFKLFLNSVASLAYRQMHKSQDDDAAKSKFFANMFGCTCIQKQIYDCSANIAVLQDEIKKLVRMIAIETSSENFASLYTLPPSALARPQI